MVFKKLGKKLIIPASLLAAIMLSSAKANAEGRAGPENIKAGSKIELKTGSSAQGNFVSAKATETKPMKVKNFNFNMLFGAGMYVPKEGEYSQAARVFVGGEKKFDWNGKKLSVGLEAVPEVLDKQGRGVRLGGEYDVGAKFSLPGSGQLKKTTFFINGVNLSNEPTEYGRIVRLGVQFDPKRDPVARLYFENNDSGSKLAGYFQKKIGRIKKIQVVGRLGASVFEDMSAAPNVGVGVKGIKILGEKGEFFLNYEGPSRSGKGKELNLSFGLRE